MTQQIIVEESSSASQVKPNRNDPCPCGSGRKAKRCHLLDRPPDGVPIIVAGRLPMSGGREWPIVSVVDRMGVVAPATLEQIGAQGRTASFTTSRNGEPMIAALDAGAGDVIHAVRHLERIERDGPVIWVTRPTMTALLRHSFPAATFVDRWPFPPPTPWRSDTLSILPLRADAPARAYLRAPAPRAYTRPRVGLCLRGEHRAPFDRWRSIHDPAVVALLRDAPVDWVDLTGLHGDWADTANVVAGLDQVVSVDTGVAHLAGALGVPLWLLNRAGGPGDPGPDRRWDVDWLQPGPLYPRVRVFQQADRDLGWMAVARAVVLALTQGE